MQHVIVLASIQTFVLMRLCDISRMLSGRLEDYEEWVPFDDMRIHPECYMKYHWARQICTNALDVESEDYIALAQVHIRLYTRVWLSFEKCQWPRVREGLVPLFWHALAKIGCTLA